MVERIEVTFQSQGVQCAGTLYRAPGASGRLPCVVLATGFSGTMDWILPAFAHPFAEAGFAALTFDYRHFGRSEGEPRQLINVEQQRQDVCAAIACARSRPDVDPTRIALWGTSLGGGHVIEVAAWREPDVRAVIAQVPGIDMVRKDSRALFAIPAWTIVRLLAAAAWDGVRGLAGLPPFYVKVFGERGELAVFSDPALKPRFDAVMKVSATWRNEFAPRFYLSPPRYREGTAERLKAPLLVCIAEHEVYANPAFQAWVGRQAPRGKVKFYSAGHFDLYHPPLQEQVVDDQIAFLKRWL